MIESNEKLTKEELLEQMKRCWHLYSLPESKVNLQAYKQLREIIEEAYVIPDTSEREEELEALLIKMQDELDKQQKPVINKKTARDVYTLIVNENLNFEGFWKFFRQLGLERIEDE